MQHMYAFLELVHGVRVRRVDPVVQVAKEEGMLVAQEGGARPAAHKRHFV